MTVSHRSPIKHTRCAEYRRCRLPCPQTRRGAEAGEEARAKERERTPIRRRYKEATRLRRVPTPVTTLQGFVGAIRPAIQPRILDPRASLHRREARTRFPESAVGNRISRSGQTEDMSIHRVMILPDLMLTGAPRLQRSQAYDRRKSSTPLERHASLESESAAMTATAV